MRCMSKTSKYSVEYVSNFNITLGRLGNVYPYGLHHLTNVSFIQALVLTAHYNARLCTGYLISPDQQELLST